MTEEMSEKCNRLSALQSFGSGAFDLKFETRGAKINRKMMINEVALSFKL
jgi:hypothetical protein